MSSRESTAPQRPNVHIAARMDTRWSDVDIYGHVNNVAYYAYVDSAIATFLMGELREDLRRFDAIGIVAETSCRYLAEIDFPAQVEIGLATERIGTSSVVYRFAIFAAGDDTVRATGRFVHVYVDRDQRTPTAIPDRIRTIVSGLPRWESATGVSA
jgi:acyl-CoA thioester hydrolase